MTAHKHAEVIKAWADGIATEYRYPRQGAIWQSMADFPASPTWDADIECRIAPAAPKWPASTMSDDDLVKEWNSFDHGAGRIYYHASVRNIANAVLEHALESQQVVLMSEVQEIARELNKSLREKEKMAVARVVREACRSCVKGDPFDILQKSTFYGMISGVDLSKAIAAAEHP